MVKIRFMAYLFAQNYVITLFVVPIMDYMLLHSEQGPPCLYMVQDRHAQFIIDTVACVPILLNIFVKLRQRVP